MADATANLKLGLVDDGFVAGITNISTQITNLQLASTAVSAALPLLEKGLRSNASQYLVGAQNAEKLASGMRNIIGVNKDLNNIIGKASNVAFYGQQLATLAKGASDAYTSLKRIPETLEQMERSGVSTGSIQGFMTLRDAIGGSQQAVESFAQTAVAKLNAVEQASARVGTILKSSTSFTDQGIAKRANADDLTQNRKQIQGLLRDRLDNTVTTTEALLGQYEVLSGGFTSTKASQQVLDPGLKLIGIAGAGGQGVDPTATLQLLTKTLRAYGLEASQATRVSAILNGTVENGITTIQELSMTFGQASQVAKTAGIAIEDLAAATSVLTAQGTSTPVALTGIQALSRSIIDKTPEAAKELAKLRDAEGNRIRFDIREVQQKGLVKAIQDLFQSTGGNQELLAKILPDSLAYRTALGLNSNKGQDFANVATSIRANANEQSLNEVFETATSDRISRFEKIANRFEETIIQLGESLAPVFEPGIAYLEKLSKLVTNIPDPIKKAIGAYLAFQIQAKAGGIAFGQLSGAIVSVLSNFALLRVINLVITGQFGKQVAIIKDLILQKKGLGAVVKQIVGFDQSHLLTTEGVTDAITKEGVVQRTVNAVKEKANDITKKNIKGFIDQTEAVKKNTQAVSGVRGKFAEYIETIRNTTVGKKIDEITGRFTSQKEAIKDLAKGTQEYFDNLKNASVEQANQLKNQAIQQPQRPIDKQIEAYRQKRLAELAIATDAAYSAGDFGSLLNTDPEAQRETRRRELLEERARRNQARKERRSQEQAEARGLGAVEGLGLFGDFLTQDRADRLEGSGRRIDIPDSPDSFGDAVRSDRDRLREKARSRGFGDLNKTRQLFEAGELAGQVTTKIDLLEASMNGIGTAATILGSGVAQGFGLISSLAGEALIALGPIVPLIAVIGAGVALVGKEIQHLFGGGAANDLSRGLQGTLDKLKELDKETGRDGALLTLKNDLANLAETGVTKITVPQEQLKSLQSDISGGIEEGILDKVRSAVAFPFEKINELAGFIGDKTGEIIDNTLNPIESVKAVEDLAPFQSRIEQLRGEGKLTQGQFSAMGDAFRKAGEDGKITAQELSVLQNQIEAFRAGAPGKIEEGVIDKIRSTLSLEGLGKLTNYIGNTAGAAVKNLLNPFGEFTTAEDINAEREADKLLKPLSQLRQVLDQVGDSSTESALKTKQLTQGIFLTQEARELAAKGSQIQGTALSIENKATDDQIKKNEQLISSYQEQSKTIAENIKKTTDPGLKQQLTDQFSAAQSQIDGLQKRSEALKQAREAIVKYYNETLPVLQQTIINSAVNPLEAQRGLEESLEVFRDKYVDEGQTFLKDIQQQRTEGQAALDQILQNYDRNLLGTAEAGAKVREVLDQSFISVTKDGRQIKGSIFDIDTQKNLINQISQFQSQATAERLTQIEIESSTITTAGQLRQSSEEDVVKRTTELQKERLNLQRNQIAEEIQLRLQYGLKVTDLENKLRQTTLEIAQAEFNEREKLIQKQLERRIQAIEVQRSEIGALTSERGLSEEAAQSKIAQLQIDESNLRANELKRQLDEYAANGVKNVQLENQYAQARNQIREAEAKEAERLIQQQLQQRTQAFEIEKNQLQTLAEEGKLGQEDLAEELSKLSVDQAKLKEQDITRQVEELKANGQSSISLEQELSQQRLQIRSIEAREKRRIREQELEQDIAVLEQEKGNFDVLAAEGKLGQEKLQTESSRIAIAQAQLREADLKKQLDDLEAVGKTSTSLENQYAQQRLQIRNLEAQERKRLIEEGLQQRIKALGLEQAGIETQLAERTISEQDAQRAIAQNRIEQERLQLSELDRQLQTLAANGQTSVSLEQQAATARLNIRKAEAEERNRLEDLQLETLKKQLENENQRSSLRREALDQEYDLLQKQAQLIEGITNSRNQLADAESQFVQAQLQNQSRLTRDPLQQAEIEMRMIGERKADLIRTQQAEQESLKIRQQLQAIDFERQKSQLETQQLETESQRKILEIELQRAILQRRTPEEIEAIRLQIQANEQRSQSLGKQGSLLNQQINQQSTINGNEQKRIALSQQTAQLNLATEETLQRQKLVQEQIDKVAKDYSLTQQKLQQQYEKQSATLENQSTIFGFQKQLIEARQKAFDDSLNLTTSELDLASRLANSDRERQAIAQTTSNLKLKALQEQQEAEREVLLINQAQAKVQQEIEAIRLKGQQSQNLADIAQAQADLAKVQATGNATPQEMLAAQLNLQAKQQAGQALNVQAALQPLQSQLLGITQQQELDNLNRKQRLDQFNARADAASGLGLVDRTRANQNLQTELLSGLYGESVNGGNVRGFFDRMIAGNRLDAVQQFGLGNNFNPNARSFSNLVPQINTPNLTVPNLEDIQPPNVELGFPSVPMPGQQAQSGATAPIQNNNVSMEMGGITIRVEGGSQDMGQKLEQEILDTFDRVMTETKRRLG